MSLHSTLAELRQRGVVIKVDGGDLVVTGADRLRLDEIERLRAMKAEILALLRPGRDGWTAEDWQAFFNERAGVAEHDGGASRTKAEQIAFESCVALWLARNPTRSSLDRCCGCGGTEQSDDVLLPLGVGTAGHAWLHSRCWSEWRDARVADATGHLDAMKIREPKGKACHG